MENLKKNQFFHFWIKNEADQVFRWLISQIFYNKTQKLLCQELLKGLNLKVTKYELIISNQSEMADDHLPGGAPGAPPHTD